MRRRRKREGRSERGHFCMKDGMQQKKLIRSIPVTLTWRLEDLEEILCVCMYVCGGCHD